MSRSAAVGLAAGLLAVCGQMRAAASETDRDLGIIGRERLVEALNEKAVLADDGSWRIVSHGARGSADTAASSTGGGFPVLYRAGRPRTSLTRRIVTGKLTVLPAAGADPDAIARDHGLQTTGICTDAGPYHIFRTAPAADAVAALRRLQADPQVAFSELMLTRQMALRGVPDDPLFPQQWHLKQTPPANGGPIDLNVEPAWGSFGGPGWRGRNVRIGIVDDGIQLNHPDLAGRLDLNLDRNWNGVPAVPADNGGAQNPADSHGTAVAGLAAATANNGIGVAGVAPEATLVSLRLLAGPHDDEDEAQCFDHLAGGVAGGTANTIAIKSCSWGPEDGEFQLFAPGASAREALLRTTTSGRGGRGTIYVWAVGNGGDVGEDANLDGYANDIHVIAVGSVDASGQLPDSSEPGACLAVCAPSKGTNRPGLVTTDRTGSAGFNSPGAPADLTDRDYTKQFGGTSAATPQIAGVCALMLQANPTLGWRDVKEILMCTARRIDTNDPGWFVNGAGFHFNDRYGAGLADAAAATALAGRWANLGPLRPLVAGTSQFGFIPDNLPAGLTRTFDLSSLPRRRVEHATVTVDIAHRNRGDLNITLTSPAGTVSTLARPNFVNIDQEDFKQWTFSTLQMWGELSTGKWTLRIVDNFEARTGSLSGATLTIWGTEPSNPPTFTSASVGRCVVGQPFSHTVTTGNGPNKLSVQEPLPPGLKFDPVSGLIEGACTERGEYLIVFRATNRGGTAAQEFQLHVLSPYQQWAAAYHLEPGHDDPDDDPDGDGVPNVLEYAGGGAPDASGPPPAGRVEREANGGAAFSFTRWPLRKDAVWLVEFSTDCDHWESVAHSINGAAVEPMPLAPTGRFLVAETPQPDDSVAVRIIDTDAPSGSGWFRLRALLDD